MSALRVVAARGHSDCFFDAHGNTQLVITLAGGGNSWPLKTNFDQNAVIQTAFHLDPTGARWTVDGQAMTCFDSAVHPYTDQIPLGTLALTSIDFINAFSPGNSVEARSYKVTFDVHQDAPTGDGSLPSGLQMTCITVKDPVQNQWVFRGCEQAG